MTEYLLRATTKSTAKTESLQQPQEQTWDLRIWF